MGQPARTTIDRLLGTLPDWMFLAAGLTLLSLALVTPNWLSCEALARQRDLMRLQAERLRDQRERYETFFQALVDHDPIVLERLAFTQLGLKPVGKQVLSGNPSGTGGDTESRRQAELLATSASVDQWLIEPLPQPGVDVPLYQPSDTRLIRLTANPMLRAGLFAAAIACLAAGLWPSAPRPGDDESTGAAGDNAGSRAPAGVTPPTSTAVAASPRRTAA
jgi:hypothetical protein